MKQAEINKDTIRVTVKNLGQAKALLEKFGVPAAKHNLFIRKDRASNDRFVYLKSACGSLAAAAPLLPTATGDEFKGTCKTCGICEDRRNKLIALRVTLNEKGLCKDCENKTPIAASNQAQKKVSVASFMRGLILAGKTNDEVFAAAQKELKIDGAKKNYPAWYRAELKRNGRIA